MAQVQKNCGMKFSERYIGQCGQRSLSSIPNGDRFSHGISDGVLIFLKFFDRDPLKSVGECTFCTDFQLQHFLCFYALMPRMVRNLIADILRLPRLLTEFANPAYQCSRCPPKF